MPVSSPARTAFLATLVLSLSAADPPFPLSRYPMYSALGGRLEGAVPVYLADGVAADLREYVGFFGLGAEAFAPAGVPLSQGYHTRDTARWVLENGGQGGPVRIDVGYERLRVEDGRLVRERVIVASGTAVRR